MIFRLGKGNYLVSSLFVVPINYYKMQIWILVTIYYKPKQRIFIKKLWSLQLPSKITFTIWRISWDFIPNFVNLSIRRVVSNDRCPRCSSEVEDSLHIFRDCPGFSRGETMTNAFPFAMRYGGYGFTDSQDPF